MTNSTSIQGAIQLGHGPRRRVVLMDDSKAAKPAPLTVSERQAAFRARRAMLEGAAEVRGIYLPLELHAKLKAYARTLGKQAA